MIQRGQATPILAMAAAPRRVPDGREPAVDTGTELDRIILYVPARILDLAEVLAEKAGVTSFRITVLSSDAGSGKRARERKVSDFEARRGPLEGLKQIADDPDYLAEWQTQSGTRPEAPSPAEPAIMIRRQEPTGGKRAGHRRHRVVEQDVRALELAPENDGLVSQNRDEKRDQLGSIVVESVAGVVRSFPWSQRW